MTTAKPPLLTRPLLLRLVSIVASSIGFFLPLSVVPLFAAQAGAAGGAGLATVALLVSTVLCELVTPRLVAFVGYRWALAIGLTLLGAPTAVLAFSDSTAAILAVSVVRGAGFAVATVAGGALTATLIPAGRRGEGLALVGLASGIPSMLALPAGVWAAVHWGFAPVFLVTAAVTLLALLSVPGLPENTTATTEAGGVLAALREPRLTRPATLFAASAAAAGVLVTFLPLALGDHAAWVAAAALLLQPAAATAARWVTGRIGDRRGHTGMLAPGLAVSAAGMAMLAATSAPAAVLAGAVVFGAGFGVLQNATLTLMYARVPAGGEGPVSAIWNAAYDLGMAAGALGANVFVASLGYPLTFLLTAALMLPALFVLRERRPRAVTLPAWAPGTAATATPTPCAPTGS